MIVENSATKRDLALLFDGVVPGSVRQRVDLRRTGGVPATRLRVHSRLAEELQAALGAVNNRRRSRVLPPEPQSRWLKSLRHRLTALHAILQQSDSHCPDQG